MPQQFKTIKDLLTAYYTTNGISVSKADAPILTTTTGVYNPTYGAMAFSQLNMEGNVFALMPKLPLNSTGYRAITARAGSAAGGGVSEGGAVPDSIKPTFALVLPTIKEVAHTIELSKKEQGMYATKNDVFPDMDSARKYLAAIHAQSINEQMLLDGNTLAGSGFESIDRITASAAYATAASWTAADEDIYGIDRSAAGWSDAYVSHNSGTDRFFSDNLLRDALAQLEVNGARTNIILTGSDIKWDIVGLYQNIVRYPGVLQANETVQIGVNGVTTETGVNGGVRVASVYNIPLFVSQGVVKDTKSRIYLLDTTTDDMAGVPRLFVALLYPTLYFESSDIFAIGKFTTKGVYYTSGELVCTFFAAQGSIRDLK